MPTGTGPEYRGRRGPTRPTLSGGSRPTALDTDAIRLLGDPVLRTSTELVTVFDASLVRLVARMMQAIVAADGVGLAANQIGVQRRVFVYDLRDGRRGHVVNPTLHVAARSEVVESLEGCLSVPGQHHLTPRVATAAVHGVDADGQPVKVSGDGLMARCLQHEVDHLDGVLFLDLLAPMDRRKAMDAFTATLASSPMNSR